MVVGSLISTQDKDKPKCLWLITQSVNATATDSLASLMKGTGVSICHIEGSPRPIETSICKSGAAVVDATSPHALDWVKNIAQSQPSLPIAMICDGSALENCMYGLQLGASSVLSSKADTAIMKIQIAEVLRGGAVLIPKVAREILKRMRNGQPLASYPSETEAEPSILTERELQLIDLMNKGLKQKEMAELLGISTNTVSTLLRRAYKKLGVSSRIQATQRAQSLGLINQG